VDSNPHSGDHFSCTFHLDQSMEAKIEWKLTWHCCICCNPAKGRVDFVDGWLIKSSFITKDEMKASQLTRTKLPEKNQCLPMCMYIGVPMFVSAFDNGLVPDNILSVRTPMFSKVDVCLPKIYSYSC
jgi:hypothetical protein